jgi:hypothetical protein
MMTNRGRVTDICRDCTTIRVYRDKWLNAKMCKINKEIASMTRRLHCLKEIKRSKKFNSHCDIAILRKDYNKRMLALKVLADDTVKESICGFCINCKKVFGGCDMCPIKDLNNIEGWSYKEFKRALKSRKIGFVRG